MYPKVLKEMVYVLVLAKFPRRGGICIIGRCLNKKGVDWVHPVTDTGEEMQLDQLKLASGRSVEPLDVVAIPFRRWDTQAQRLSDFIVGEGAWHLLKRLQMRDFQWVHEHAKVPEVWGACSEDMWVPRSWAERFESSWCLVPADAFWITEVREAPGLHTAALAVFRRRGQMFRTFGVHPMAFRKLQALAEQQAKEERRPRWWFWPWKTKEKPLWPRGFGRAFLLLVLVRDRLRYYKLIMDVFVV